MYLRVPTDPGVLFRAHSVYTRTKKNLTTIAKKVCLSLDGEIQLLLFASEAAPNTTLLEKHAATEIASFKEANVHIIGFAKKTNKKKQAKQPCRSSLQQKTANDLE